MHQTAGLRPGPDAETAARGSQYFETYPGYVTTKIVNRQADEDHLAAVAAKINAAKRPIAIPRPTRPNPDISEKRGAR